MSIHSSRFLWSWRAPRRSLWSTKHLERCEKSCVFDTFVPVDFPSDSSYLKTVFLLLAWQKEDLVVTLLAAGHCPGSVM